MSKNQMAADRLHKIIGHREFTARTAVEILAEDGFRWTPHANGMTNILKRDRRFVKTRKTSHGTCYKKYV
jgi:hypothetical protein